MPREKPYYREILADLAEKFDDKMLVRIGEGVKQCTFQPIRLETVSALIKTVG